MANYDPDKEMFDQVKEGIKKLGDILTQWQQKETAIHSLAENSAKGAGAPPEHMDAHVYMHKKAIKKAMEDHAKQMEAQGTPTAQDMPGGPTSIAPQLPQGPQGSIGLPGGSMTAGVGPLVGPPTGPTPGGQGGPGFNYGGTQPDPQLGNFGQGRGGPKSRFSSGAKYVYGGSQSGVTPNGQGGPGPGKGDPATMVARNTPILPMAGQTKNTGANGWEGLLKPTNVPMQGVVQNGQPNQSVGPMTKEQKPLPGMPHKAVPFGFDGANYAPMASQTNTLPTVSPPLTKPMQ